jgi:flagellar biosynthesis/type III secretory pathway protein FliH
MGVILSSEAFNPNGKPWTRKGSLGSESFLGNVVSSEKQVFEPKLFSAPPIEKFVEDEEEVHNEAQDEKFVAAEEISFEEPLERTVTFTEAEYQKTLADVKLEAEAQVAEALEGDAKEKLEKLANIQQESFLSLEGNLNNGGALVSEFVSLALKLGSLLARTQLTLDEEVIVSFVKSALNDLDNSDANIFSINVSNEWKKLNKVIGTHLPQGIDLVFDDALKPGDAILKAGHGGYFDLLSERIKNIQSQLDLLDNHVEEKAAIEFFHTPSAENPEINPEYSEPANTELEQRLGEVEGPNAGKIDGGSLGEDVDVLENEDLDHAESEEKAEHENIEMSSSDKHDNDEN